MNFLAHLWATDIALLQSADDVRLEGYKHFAALQLEDS